MIENSLDINLGIDESLGFPAETIAHNSILSNPLALLPSESRCVCGDSGELVGRDGGVEAFHTERTTRLNLNQN